MFLKEGIDFRTSHCKSSLCMHACPIMGTQVSILAFSVCNWDGVYKCVVPSDMFGVVRECKSGKVHYTVKYLIWFPRRRFCVRMSYFGSPCPPPPPATTSSSNWLTTTKYW